jgi:hypothetical protein
LFVFPKREKEINKERERKVVMGSIWGLLVGEYMFVYVDLVKGF